MFTNEQITEAKKCNTVDELIAYAKKAGHELKDEKANALFAQMHPSNGEVADDELENVSGGCNEETPWQCPSYSHMDGRANNANDCTTCNSYVLHQMKGKAVFEWGCRHNEDEIWDDYRIVLENAPDITNYDNHYWYHYFVDHGWA